MQSPFFALVYRLRSTLRWSGMNALQSEDVAQHSFGVALIAQALCAVEQEVFHRSLPTADILAAALLHDASECILTDVIAPVKKYSVEVEQAFSHLEQVAEKQLRNTLPNALQPMYEQWFQRSGEVFDYVKAADKLDALCKCRQEVRRGNQEFALAASQIESSVRVYADRMPSVAYFIDHFLEAFDHSVDEYRYLK
ncbi:5'-deoxynucleotidase [Alicyclobacillaceae bacterium I2511]|nr:5'-deoxynucleotidase [Alicyclobacillaceae bacterium I2511]